MQASDGDASARVDLFDLHEHILLDASVNVHGHFFRYQFLNDFLNGNNGLDVFLHGYDSLDVPRSLNVTVDDCLQMPWTFNITEKKFS